MAIHWGLGRRGDLRPWHLVEVALLNNYTNEVSAILNSPTGNMLENMTWNMKYVYANTMDMLSLFYTVTTENASVSFVPTKLRQFVLSA